MLNTLAKFSTRKGKAVGRGYGSGKGGHTIGKGTKGHKSRSGYKNPRPGFEGGQMPLSRRIPKLKGDSRAYLKIKEGVSVIRTQDLNMFNDGDTVNAQALIDMKLMSTKYKTAKVVLKGDLTKKLNLEGLKVSKSVQAIIEKLGGAIK